MKTLKKHIKEVADRANLTPEAAALIQNFFLEVATQEEKDKLDAWMNESTANDRLFDLFLKLNRDGAGAAFLHVLRKNVKKPVPKWSRTKWVIRIVIAVSLSILLIDYLVPSKPIASLVHGKSGRKYVTKIVEAGDESKIFWLPDSTRVELMPHSKFGYTDNYFLYIRKVQLWGSAQIEVRKSIQGPLRIKTGDNWLEITKGELTILNDSGRLVIQQHEH